MAEVARRPVRRAQLDYVPAPFAALSGEGGDEAVYGHRVLQGAQQQAAAPARDFAPGERAIGVQELSSPAPPREADGGAVTAGEDRQPRSLRTQRPTAMRVMRPASSRGSTSCETRGPKALGRQPRSHAVIQG